MTNRKTLTITALAAGALAFGTAHGELTYRAHNRLINTPDAIVVPQGRYELSAGVDYLTHTGRRAYRNNWGITSQREKARVYDWNLTARAGLADDMDAFVSTSWADIKDRSYPYGDHYGRGLDDLTIGIKYVVWRDREDVSVAYEPSLTIPAWKYSSESGRLGPGNNFWSLDQTLAATRDWKCVSGSMALTQTIPFGEGRHHYSMPFLNEQRKTRGTTGVDAGLVYTDLPVQPVVELNYLHEWVSKGNDADLLATTVGARMALGSVGQVSAGMQYPLAGRNSHRGTTFSVGFTAEF